MGNPLFGVNISKLIKDNVGPGVLDATLIKVTPGTRTPSDPTAGTNPTTQNFACKGFIDRQARRNIEGTLVSDGTVTIVLIGDTIDSGNTAPESGDQIVIEGKTYTITDRGAIDRDPAGATYTIVAE